MNWFSLFWFKASTFSGFEWQNPLALWALLFIPILFFLKWVFSSQQKRSLSLPIGNISKIESIFVYSRYLIPIFNSLAIACLLIAIARPQSENKNNGNIGSGIDIALGIDISESMTAKDLNPNRLDAAKTIAINFIKNRKQDRLSLVAFAGEPLTISPLTTDYELLINQLENLNPSLISVSGTALGVALSSCINKLRDVPGESKVCILISDGDNTTGNISPDVALELANSFNIRVYTIGVGNDPTTAKLDFNVLQSLAKGTKGQYFKANDNKALENIFKKIDVLEKSRATLKGNKVLEDRYYIYLFWALTFFLIALFLDKTFIGNILED